MKPLKGKKCKRPDNVMRRMEYLRVKQEEYRNRKILKELSKSKPY